MHVFSLMVKYFKINKMNIKHLLLACALICLQLTAFSQTQTPIDEFTPYIEVYGNAEQEVIPDEIYIQITIKEKYEDRIKITVSEQEEKLIAALTSININLSNLFLSDVNSDYVKVSWQSKDVITKKEYSLKVTNAQTVGLVFQELDKLDMNDAYIARVDYSKMDSLKQAIKIMAIKDAKLKADYLLHAIDEKTGTPLIIKETESLSNIAYSDLNMKGSRADKTDYFIDGIKVNSPLQSEIQFNKIKVKSTIYVKFAIQ
jgi:uncharacterized protein YggE